MLHIKLIIPIFVEKEVSYVEYRIYFFEIEFSTRAGHFS